MACVALAEGSMPEWGYNRPKVLARVPGPALLAGSAEMEIEDSYRAIILTLT